MGSHGTDEVMTPSEMEPNCSEAIVEIKIKTLDSQTYTLRVNKYMPVPALKEQIATVTGVLSEQQRLICRGKVLKDDQLLSAYHVEDGHTLHLVVRQPFHSSSTSGAGSTGPERMPNQSGADPVASSTRGQGNTVAAHSVVLGTFNVSDQGDAAMSDVNRFLSAVLTSVGLVNRGSRNEESDSGVTGPERRERLVGTTVMMDPAPRHQPSLATYRAQLDSLHGGAFRFPTSMSAGPLLPLVIPDSLTTLSQYLQNMRQEFSINGQDHDINLPAGEAHNLESHNPDTVARADLVQGGLPTPAALAGVAMSTRQFLIEQVGDCLSQLARRLQEEANVTDPTVRTSIQSSAMGTGVLLQNAGALLLELGRATMTLRMGQTTSEAVVNAGPPVFISTTGPNPIMVQSLPFIPGTGFGTIPMGIMHPGHTLANGALGTGFVPRTIDIRIRTGSSGSADQGEHAAGTQVGASDQARPTGSGISMQNVSPSSGFPSVATESGGVRVVPVRTVVAAVPAAVSRPASDASSGGALGVFYPLLARIQNLDPGHLNDASRSTRVGDHHRNTETDEHQVSESSIRSQNVYSTRENSSINFCSSDTAPQHQGASTSNPSEPSQAVPTTTASDVQAGASGPSDGDQHGYMSEAFNRFDQFLRTVFSGNHMHSSTGIPGLSSGPRETFPQNEQSGEASGMPQTDGASGTALDQGMFLSQVLHQAMPFIHQHLAQETSPPLVSGACHETSTSANTTIDTPASSSSEYMQHQAPGTDSSQQVERKRTCDGAGNDLQHIDGPDSSPPDSKRQRKQE